jgi:hypothetical protein
MTGVAIPNYREIDIVARVHSFVDMLSLATFQRRLCHSGNLIAGI